MKRPILIAVIGYIMGIIVGLYLEISIVPIYILISAIYLIYKYSNIQKSNKLKLLSIKRYKRYIKIYLNLKVIILLIISSIISNSIVLFQNNQYKKIYNELSNKENLNLIGIVISNKEEKQYYNKYKIETKYNSKKINLYISTDKNIELKYGNKIIFSGTYTKPEVQRNYKGYDYSKYLKQLKIYGTIKCENIKIIQTNQANKIFQISNEISAKIITNTKKILTDETSSILLGLILGYKADIDEETQEDFRNASMSHILAVSGMHITYVILGMNIILKNVIGKKPTHILSIFILIIYMFITNFSPSVTRAGIMGIIMLFSKIIYRKNDIYTSISISLLLILMYNPFLIQNLGLVLSYGGVIGIIIFNKSILKFLKNIKIKNKIYKYKIRPRIHKFLDKIKEIISVSISVEIFILPIILYNLNTFNPYFLISNLVLSIVIGPIVILGFLFIIIVLINLQIAEVFSKIVEVGIQIITIISKIGELPLSKIYIATPSTFSIITYYLCSIVLFFIYEIYSSQNPNKTQIRMRNLVALLKINIRKNKLKVQKILISLLLSLIIINLIPKNLKVHFIDVGQGDSSLIITPQNKTILIDGGGSTNSEFDVGKNTLLPYILDRGFTKIDIIIISHFDNDHVGGIFEILNELKVKKVYISKQIEKTENYKKFLEITTKRNIKVYEVIAGNRIQVERNLYFDVLWPKDNQITTNISNNNAIVCNLHYKKFSMLFTGDIEKIAEEEILDFYNKNKFLLKSDILKVGHHGSKTSTSSNFLNITSPEIAIIGVGKNNKFGHPNEEVLKRLENICNNIYRTDLNGEIIISVNNNGKIKVVTTIR
ncbi:MAG: DNA internalization-related competence protein ComEC/Rec2 [Clostridia bacterium]|nr:DNA internalization-related competence protein ComEC/Rec2 [Clostridia bacterium]